MLSATTVPWPRSSSRRIVLGSETGIILSQPTNSVRTLTRCVGRIQLIEPILNRRQKRFDPTMAKLAIYQ